MTELQSALPPGWDCKLDDKTGRHYYVNHFTKSTTWEDPRLRHRPFQKHLGNMEHIPLQHGSPESRRNYVYPSQPSPIPAFMPPGHHSPKSIPLQEFRSIRMSPLTVRAKTQDSSFSTEDEAVSKISAMFPTVSETHIKMLMKKYHSREALVISALQVEKHPITTPGPFATPPPQRNIQIHAPLHMTPPLGKAASLGASPILRASGSNHSSPRDYRSSPRPHSSPKLKLRYMKSIFPNAEETIILDVLQGNENNIQKSSEVLREMGYSKKDTVKAAQLKLEAKIEVEKAEEAKAAEAAQVKPVKLKTLQEKSKLKEELQKKYKDVAEHLITIALESVDFDENRANQILQIMVQENKDNEKSSEKNEIIIQLKEEGETEVDAGDEAKLPISQSRQSIKSLLKTEKHCLSKLVEDDNPQNLNSGPNKMHAKGANEKLLLEEYVKWQGPNLSLRKGSQKLAQGPNLSLLSNRSYKACGSNAEIRKGPKFGLAKGSIFSQMKSVLVGESRGK